MSSGPRVASPPGKPLFLFDGDCDFCRWWVARWRSSTGDRVEYLPWQDQAGRFPEISPADFERSSRLVLPDGSVRVGAEAVFSALETAPGATLWSLFYRHVPGFARVAERVYLFFARHRGGGFVATRFLWGRRPERDTYLVSSALFLRLVALCFAAAFVSLGFQIDGLVGPHGILPANDLLAWARGRMGLERYWLLPTLVWISGSTVFLQGLCAAGAAAALAATAGIAPAFCLAVCWAFSLSLAVAGQVFLEFQWDALLLETGLLAILLAPRALLPRRSGPPPSRWTRFLLVFLLFRLMFSSGWVKLASGDPLWRAGTALTRHYETQPLPTWVGWFFHQMPLAFHEASALFLFAVELAVPFLFFAPRRLRLFGAASTLTLQALIAATGNYAYFNLLAASLAILLIDDGSFLALGRRRARPDPAGVAPTARRWPRLLLVPVTAWIFLSGVVLMTSMIWSGAPWPPGILALVRLGAPFRSVNSYGLFAVMTTRRPEISVEGSDDGTIWKGYEFHWKPGDPFRRPAFVAPHQPRLDWQMWFAALGTYPENPWFVAFLGRLLEGSPPVLGLLRTNPFPRAPPRYVRAVLFDYRFSTTEERRRTRAWWVSRPLGVYLAPISRETFSGSGPRRDGFLRFGLEAEPALPSAPASSVTMVRWRPTLRPCWSSRAVSFLSRKTRSIVSALRVSMRTGFARRAAAAPRFSRAVRAAGSNRRRAPSSAPA